METHAGPLQVIERVGRHRVPESAYKLHWFSCSSVLFYSPTEFKSLAGLGSRLTQIVLDYSK